MFVTITCIYGIELNFSYILTFLLTNIYYTAGEYFFHKVTFHNPDYFFTLSKSHSKHHDQPTNEKRLFIPIIVTLINDILFILINYFCYSNIIHFISASHFSYLLFEIAHYSSHIPNYILLPKRLISFHNHHHYNDTKNYGFTTPFWDLLFNTSSNFSIYYYPLCYIPISIISFLSIEEITVMSNIIYLYTSYCSYLKGFYIYSLYYILTGITSMIYHTNKSNIIYKRLDYAIATGYFIINLYFYINYKYLVYEPLLWCLFSLLLFVNDKNHYTHILWHLSTAIGVGRMFN